MFFLAVSIFVCQLVYCALLGYGFRQAERRWGAPPPSPERVRGASSGRPLADSEAGRSLADSESVRSLADSEAVRPLPPMSVVVAARDEAENISHLLRALDRQTHPHYEVVIVDDASTDRTAAIVREFLQAHKQMPIRLVTVSDPQPPRKKHALARGIEAAGFDHLAFTDADCRPAPEWLAAHAAFHADRSSANTLVTGYSPYHGGAGLLGAAAAYETFVTGVLTAAAAGLGRPYMGLGRNMSYPRELFRRAGGFAHSEASLSGDDDLFVQHVAAMADVDVVHPTSPASQVVSRPPDSWAAWLHQKRRHTSAGRFYRRSAKLHLALFHGTNIALWVAPLVAGLPGAALLAGKLALQYAVLRRASSAFGWAGSVSDEPLPERHFSALTFPALELFYAGYNLMVAPLGLAKIPERW